MVTEVREARTGVAVVNALGVIEGVKEEKEDSGECVGEREIKGDRVDVALKLSAEEAERV